MSKTEPRSITVSSDDLLKHPGEFGFRLAATDTMDKSEAQSVRSLGAFLGIRLLPRYRNREGEIRGLVQAYNRVNRTNLTLEKIQEREKKLIAEQRVKP